MYYKFSTSNGYFSQAEAIVSHSSLQTQVKYKHKNSIVVVNRAIKQVAVQIMHKNHFNQVRQKVKNHQH